MDRRTLLKSGFAFSILSLLSLDGNDMEIVDANDDDYCPYRHVWLNFEEVSGRGFKALLPKQPGGFGWGWVDLYKVDSKGDFVLVWDEEGAVYDIAYDDRFHGIVMWQPIS